MIDDVLTINYNDAAHSLTLTPGKQLQLENHAEEPHHRIMG
jgi:hypothetical protein